MPDPARPAPTRSIPACPICGRPTDPKRRPFCSTRCADVDLGRWFTGQYRLPVPPAEDDADAEGA